MIPPTAGLDTVDYCEALIEQFGNPGLAHRLLQIAEDGSRKLPERILRPLEERTVNDRASPAMVFALAAWLTCVEQGTAFRWSTRTWRSCGRSCCAATASPPWVTRG